MGSFGKNGERGLRVAEGTEGGLWEVAANGHVASVLQVIIDGSIAQMFYLVKSRLQEGVEKVHRCLPLSQATVGNTHSWHNMWYGLQLTDMFLSTLSASI
jgi:hypothetical protein